MIYKHTTKEEADVTLNSILDISSDGFWDCNLVTWHVTRSHGWFRMLHYDIKLHKNDIFAWESIIHVDDYDRVMEHFEAYIQDKIPQYKIEYRCKKFDDSYLWIQDSGNIVQRSDDGKAIRMIGVHRDIDEIKKTEQLEIAKKKLTKFNKFLEVRVGQEVEKNKQQQKMMIQQSRHAQMGEILSMIAHQWRHPLNNLSLIIQNSIFKYGINKLDDYEISKLDIESSAQIKQMSNTIKEFRSFFQPDNASVKYDINRSVIDAVSIIKPLLDSENISLRIDAQDSIFVVGFPTELGQAIVNVITNSKDALVEKKITHKSIKLSLALIDDEAVLTIEDNGGGVSPAILEKVFDPYFSTKMKQHGTGLGLYMTKIIVEEHMNGKLSVSNSNNGFAVQIIIPHSVR